MDGHDAGTLGQRRCSSPDTTGTSAEAGPWARQWLWSKAAGIAGGTSQVHRDIIAGRILGLPRRELRSCAVAGQATRHTRGARGHGVICSMPRKGVVVPSGRQQPAAAQMDLASATEDDDEDRITLLETILSSGADMLLYRPPASALPRSSSVTSSRPSTSPCSFPVLVTGRYSRSYPLLRVATTANG